MVLFEKASQQRLVCFCFHKCCTYISRLGRYSSSKWGLRCVEKDYYRIYSTISRDPKRWTCRLGITRTKNKSKTPGYKPRPIHYYKTELLTTGKPNIFGKNYIDCKWGLDDNTPARIQEMQWWFIMKKASLLENTRELINITRN